MDIFEALRRSHDRQRTLCDLLVKTEGDSEGREELFASLKAELADHADAEERFFYVPLMTHGQTQQKARHSVAEHHDMDELVDTLETTDRSSPAWLATAKKLAEQVTHHLDEEEQEVFQQAGKVLSDREKTELAEQYLGLMRERGHDD